MKYEQFFDVIKQVPEGKVATYGQIAELAGMPRYARHVGFALAGLPHDTTLPWHRVVNAQGKISSRASPGGEEFQRILLEEEGIEFDLEGRIALSRYQWRRGAAD